MEELQETLLVEQVVVQLDIVVMVEEGEMETAIAYKQEPLMELEVVDQVEHVIHPTAVEAVE